MSQSNAITQDRPGQQRTPEPDRRTPPDPASGGYDNGTWEHASSFPPFGAEHQQRMANTPLPPRPLSDILRDLHLPVNEALVRERENRGGQVSDFVPWWPMWCIIERITNGHFEWNITSINFVHPPDDPPFISMVGQLTLIGSDGRITRSSAAQNELKSRYGDPTRNCEAAVLRRCCYKFGLAREVGRRPSRSKGQSRGSQQNPPAANRNDQNQNRATPGNQRRPTPNNGNGNGNGNRATPLQNYPGNPDQRSQPSNPRPGNRNPPPRDANRRPEYSAPASDGPSQHGRTAPVRNV